MHYRHPLVAALVSIVTLTAAIASAAPFDVYYRANDKANWIFYGGRESRSAADATATDLQRSTGFETKVVAFGEPIGRPEPGAAVSQSIAVGGTTYMRRPGLGYSPGWYRHGGGWSGWAAGFGGGWGGGYGGSWNHDHHSSHHHSHDHHSSSHHHTGNHPTAHPSAAGHRGAGGRGHASGSHHSHSHTHSHSHAHSHSHGGHRK